MKEMTAHPRKSWEEYISEYMEQQEIGDQSVWKRVQIIAELAGDYGEQSIRKFAQQIKEKPSTLGNYLRVARAFQPEERIPHLGFNVHLHASLADSYQGKEFEGTRRYEWLEKAAKGEWSSRTTSSHVRQEKRKYVPCRSCGIIEDVYEFVFWSPTLPMTTKRFDLHKDCFDTLIAEIEDKFSIKE